MLQDKPHSSGNFCHRKAVVSKEVHPSAPKNSTIHKASIELLIRECELNPRLRDIHWYARNTFLDCSYDLYQAPGPCQDALCEHDYNIVRFLHGFHEIEQARQI